MILASSFVNILQSVMQTLMDDVFTPIFKGIMEVITKFLGGLLWSIFGEFFLDIFIALLSLVDFMEEIFNLFSGTSLIYVNGVKTDMLTAFMRMDKVTWAFTAVTLAAMALCFAVTIYKTAKSISDTVLEDKNPISKVMKNGMKASLAFLLTPFFCVFFLQLSSVVTNQLSAAFSAATGGVNTSMGNILFLTASLNADRKTMPERNPFDDMDMFKTIEGRNPRFDDDIRRPYLEGNQLYKNLNRVKKDFYPTEFDYVTGFISSIVILFILTGAVLFFVRRLFELLLLYITAPFFASTIPGDDGILFKKWRELFVAKFFSGFGIIFTMKYYLMMLPLIAGSNLILYSGTVDSYIINNILKIFIIIGGAWAVYRSQHLILQIISPEVAMAARESASVTTGLLIGTGMKGFHIGKAALMGQIGSGAYEKLRGDGSEKKRKAEHSNALEGLSYDQAFRGR